MIQEKITMKVEASSYDTVEFTPKYIKAGEFINPPHKVKHVVLGERRKIKLRAPSRIDFGG